MLVQGYLSTYTGGNIGGNFNRQPVPSRYASGNYSVGIGSFVAPRLPARTVQGALLNAQLVGALLYRPASRHVDSRLGNI